MRSALFATLLFSAACTMPAQADQMPPSQAVLAAPHIAIASAPAKVRAPYDVQVIRESGETMPTYSKGDRFYVQGNANERYVIRVTNPTANRVEAVVSVDGLDVVDGESGDLAKRGYVVPPYGETRIEGFRTSTEDVATFRFSAVDDSYAGKKGKARNVGVIAVAIFEEQHTEQQLIIGDGPRPTPPADPGFRAPYDYNEDLDTASRSLGSDRGEGKKFDRRPEPAREKVADAPAATGSSSGGGRVAPAARAPMPMPPPPPSKRKALDAEYEDDYAPPSDEVVTTTPTTRPTNRPGLGTEFGESRYSAASYTKFVRAPGRPIAVAELRYNDAAGLMALGIMVSPMPDEGELMTRETADPFPGDSRFSRRP